jgi:ClpA/ClpB-like protein
MFERFTERARQVVVLAQQEARTLKHNYIGTEHILLGLLREEKGLAASVLESLDITVERLRAEVVAIVGNAEQVHTGQIPFTPHAKKVLELALHEARCLGHDYIGSEHVLLGLIGVKEGLAMRIMLEANADPETVRDRVTLARSSSDHAEIRAQGQAAVHSTAAPADPSLPAPGSSLSITAGVLGVLWRAATETAAGGGRSLDDGDLLLSLVRQSDGIAAQALGQLGVEIDGLRHEIARARELDSEIERVGRKKRAAIDADDLLLAAELRDQERQLINRRQRPRQDDGPTSRGRT